jgi:hypothetical protein
MRNRRPLKDKVRVALQVLFAIGLLRFGDIHRASHPGTSSSCLSRKRTSFSSYLIANIR